MKKKTGSNFDWARVFNTKKGTILFTWYYDDMYEDYANAEEDYSEGHVISGEIRDSGLGILRFEKFIPIESKTKEEVIEIFNVLATAQAAEYFSKTGLIPDKAIYDETLH